MKNNENYNQTNTNNNLHVSDNDYITLKIEETTKNIIIPANKTKNAVLNNNLHKLIELNHVNKLSYYCSKEEINTFILKRISKKHIYANNTTFKNIRFNLCLKKFLRNKYNFPITHLLLQILDTKASIYQEDNVIKTLNYLTKTNNDLINAKDSEGLTLLDKICKNPKKAYLKLANILLEKGAQLTIDEPENSKHIISFNDVAQAKDLKKYCNDATLTNEQLTIANELLKMLKEEYILAEAKYCLDHKVLLANNGLGFNLNYFIKNRKVTDEKGKTSIIPIIKTDKAKSNDSDYNYYSKLNTGFNKETAKHLVTLTPETVIEKLEANLLEAETKVYELRTKRNSDLNKNTYGQDFNMTIDQL